jgi:hypothetical protein
MWCRLLAREWLPGACLLQRVDAGSKLVLQAGHEVAGGRDDLLRIHVSSWWRDRSEGAQLVGVEDRERRKVRAVQVCEREPMRRVAVRAITMFPAVRLPDVRCTPLVVR